MYLYIYLVITKRGVLFFKHNITSHRKRLQSGVVPLKSCSDYTLRFCDSTNALASGRATDASRDAISPLRMAAARHCDNRIERMNELELS